MLSQRNNDRVVNQVLTFFSTASATGKTTLAINCAADLAERGYRVCLADCDMQFGDVANCLALEPKNSFFQIYEDDEVNAANLVVETPWGFDVLAAPSELDEGYLITPNNVVRAINHLKANYDYVVIDTTTGFGQITMAVLELTDILFLPCVVDFIPSIKNLKLGLEHLRKMQFDVNRVRLILNRNKADTEISTKDVETLLGKNFQYFIHNDYAGMMESINKAQPIVLFQRENKVADEISNMIAVELGDKDVEKSGGFLAWLWK